MGWFDTVGNRLFWPAKLLHDRQHFGTYAESQCLQTQELVRKLCRDIARTFFYYYEGCKFAVSVLLVLRYTKS